MSKRIYREKCTTLFGPNALPQESRGFNDIDTKQIVMQFAGCDDSADTPWSVGTVFISMFQIRNGLKLFRSELQNVVVETLALVPPLWVAPGSVPVSLVAILSLFIPKLVPPRNHLDGTSPFAASCNSLRPGATLTDFLKLRLRSTR